jgi:hypothetical protein
MSNQGNGGNWPSNTGKPYGGILRKGRLKQGLQLEPK